MMHKVDADHSQQDENEEFAKQNYSKFANCTELRR